MRRNMGSLRVSLKLGRALRLFLVSGIILIFSVRCGRTIETVKYKDKSSANLPRVTTYQNTPTPVVYSTEREYYVDEEGYSYFPMPFYPPLSVLPSLTFTANGVINPAAIPYNSAVTLRWTSQTATSCTVTKNGTILYNDRLNETAGISSGNLTVTTTFQLSCSGLGGIRVLIICVTVNPAPPPTPPVIEASSCRIEASPTTINAGGSTQVKVVITDNKGGITKATINGTEVSPDVAHSFSPAVNTVYSGQISGASNVPVVNCTAVTVTVRAPITFSAVTMHDYWYLNGFQSAAFGSPGSISLAGAGAGGVWGHWLLGTRTSSVPIHTGVAQPGIGNIGQPNGTTCPPNAVMVGRSSNFDFMYCAQLLPGIVLSGHYTIHFHWDFNQQTQCGPNAVMVGERRWWAGVNWGENSITCANVSWGN